MKWTDDVLDQRQLFVGSLPHLPPVSHFTLPFKDVERELNQIIADFGLPAGEFGDEIAAKHTFGAKDSENLRYLGVDAFWLSANDGSGHVVLLMSPGVDAEHTAYDLDFVLDIREKRKPLFVCGVGFVLGSVRIEWVMAPFFYTVIDPLLEVVLYAREPVSWSFISKAPVLRRRRPWKRVHHCGSLS